MSSFHSLERLREYRPLLLAVEAVGWLHMTGKAHADFLREYGGIETGYKYEKWFQRFSFPWSDLLKWVKDKYSLPDKAWPDSMDDFLEKHTKNGPGLLGLLQAAHGMVSGIEKNLPRKPSEYLEQDVTHMWLSSVFGFPERNLLVDMPQVLTRQGWNEILQEIRKTLEMLRELGKSSSKDDIGAWWDWREKALNFLRTAFTQILAETRLPNNDVTLWDQSYAAAAMFKSAVAGALLEDGFPWNDGQLKRETRWRLLTVAVGVAHYERRAVRIGDWTGARMVLDEFFTQVRKLIETELAVGSLLYKDTGIMVFSFPGERFNAQNPLPIEKWQGYVLEHLERFAKDFKLETPPYCVISEPTRSLVPMVSEIEKARQKVAVPIFRGWSVGDEVGKTDSGHVCPVCLVRQNDDPSDKQKPCAVCNERRDKRLNNWLSSSSQDTIWLDEVADENDRLALITLGLDLGPWVEGTRLDSLRTQAISGWRQHNPKLSNSDNPIDPSRPYLSLLEYVKTQIESGYNQNDPVLGSLQEGYRRERDWPTFYEKIVEDRSRTAPPWDKLNGEQRAKWVVHQLFCKLPSPGRVYRFWRQAESFFEERLREFRGIASRHPNRWRVLRLLLKLTANTSAGWKDHNPYEGYCRNIPISLLYLEEKGSFLTICNLARLLGPEEGPDALKNEEIELYDDQGRLQPLKIEEVEEVGKQNVGQLGAYFPVIPLEVSPTRFRILVPPTAAAACVDRVIADWEEKFARVWDRLPLLVGVVAFPRKLSFQAVIEAARNLEDELRSALKEEKWQVERVQIQNETVILRLKRANVGRALQYTVPTVLLDGRCDVFYPYFAVDDHEVRYPLDFWHPCGQVYRHITDLKPRDTLTVMPSLIATLFMDTAARRFEVPPPRLLSDWGKMRRLWDLITQAAESMSSLRTVWDELQRLRDSWEGTAPEEEVDPTWQVFISTVIANQLRLKGADLEQVVGAVQDGLLEWCLEWHLTMLKEKNFGDRGNWK